MWRTPAATLDAARPPTPLSMFLLSSNGVMARMMEEYR
jgi:hypothetical protein